MKISTLLFITSILSVSIAQAGRHYYMRSCLVRDTVLLSKTAIGNVQCKVVTMPKLKKSLLTYPHLGTRSFEVQYWSNGRVKRTYKIKSTYREEITNICLRELVSSEEVSEVESFSKEIDFQPTNPNLNEAVSKENELSPLSATQVQQELSAFLNDCRAQ